MKSAGIEQQYRREKHLRNRYDSVVSTNYTATDIYVRSTDYDRTLMLAQSNLIVHYEIHHVSNDNVPFQSISIHAVSVNQDVVYYFEI